MFSHGVPLEAAPALDPAALDPVTGMPRGAMVCLLDGLSWNAHVAGVCCWSCGVPGVTPAEAAFITAGNGE